jgi:DNA-3-methyladenine glycosylase II
MSNSATNAQTQQPAPRCLIRRRGSRYPPTPGYPGRLTDTAAIDHLRAADPVMGALIDRLGTDWLDDQQTRLGSKPYDVLVRAIVGQQFSTRAAAAMYARLADRFGGRLPTPDELLADDPDELRTAVGLSHAKVRYLRALAEHVRDGRLVLEELPELDDDEVIARLTAVPGIGAWSAQLFLIFVLRRPDVIASGDLGIRRAIMVADGLPGLPTPAEVDERAHAWQPHRTLAGMLLWRSVSTAPA